MKVQACAPSPSQLLVGVWQSNKKRTLEAWSRSSGTRKTIHPSLENVFGKLKIRYTAKQLHGSFEGDQWRTRYRVVWENKTDLFIVSGAGHEESGQHIHFEDKDNYWVHAGRGIEHFSRVVDAQPSLPPDVPAAASRQQGRG